MASSTYLQQAYLAYFGRPADVNGLSFYANKTEAQVVAAFSASPESQTFFGSLDNLSQINTIYQNLFNRPAEPAGLKYWNDEINAGRLSLAQASMGILAGAQNDDKKAVVNKLAASVAFTAALDTTAEMIGYQGSAVITSARAFLASVGSDAASLTAATAQSALDSTVSSVVSAGSASSAAGSTFTLTTGVDTTGVLQSDVTKSTSTAGNDTFNATAATLNVFDNIDGGAGTDTLNIDDTATGALASFSGVTLASIEKISIQSKLGLLADALNTSSATSFPGLTDLTVAMTTPGAAQTITAATTTKVTASASAGAPDLTIVGGGGTASVTTNGAGNVLVGQATTPASTDANAYTSVTAKTGTGTVDITDNSGASGVVGSTLTSVTVQSTSGATTLTGKGITDIALKDTSANVGLTNATTTAHAFNLNLKGVTTGTITDTSGYATSTAITTAATTAAGTGNTITLAGAKLAALTVDGTKSLTLTSTLNKLATVVIKGAGGVSSDFSADGATTTAGFVTSVDTTGSTAAASTTNGTIANAITIGTSTIYTGGAGVDNVTVGASTKAITLGAGNDSLTLTAALGTGATVDGGDGTDIIVGTQAIWEALDASSLINDKLSNFEKIDLGALATAAGSIELGYMAKVNNYVKIGAATNASTETINNIANGGTVELYANNVATGLTLGVKDAAFGSADSLTIALSATSSGVRAGGALTVASVETVNVVTSMTASTYVNNLDTLTLTAAAAKTIAVSGNQGLNLTHTNTALRSIDASGLTGTDNEFTFTTGALVAATSSVPTATIIGSSKGVNTITATASLKPVIISVGGTANTKANVLTGSALGDTIAGGAGDDTITGGGGLDTLTGNGGADTFVLADGSGTLSSPVIITDFVRTSTAGTNDKLSLTGTEIVWTTAVAGWTVTTSGVLTKAGASVSDFFTAAAAAVSATLETAAFENGGNTYVFYAGATAATTDDIFVQLTGVTGITSLHASTAGANVLVI